MAKTKISEFNSNPALNTDIDSINIAEGCSPSGINDAIRELMSQLKDWQSGTSNDPYVVGSSGSLTLNQGTANTVPYLNGSKVVTSGTALSFDGTNLGVGNSSPTNPLTVGGSIRGTVLVKGTNGSSPYIALDHTATASGRQYNLYSGGNNAGEFNIYDATAAAIRLTLDSSGNLGLGVTPSAWGTGTMLAFQLGSGAAFASDVGGGYRARVFANAYYASSGYKYMNNGPALMHVANANNSEYEWLIAPTGTAGNAITWTQAMTLDSSGNLLVGTTSAGGNGGFTVRPAYSAGASQVTFNRTDAGATNSAVMLFQNSGTQVGYIQYNNTSTSYGTSSDYRLKNTITPMTGALAKVALLKPVTYKWNVDGSDGQGFIAHELAEVCPDAVTGEKDAVDAEGNPQYQGIDVSFLVATLTAAIQELKAEFDAYKATHP